MNQKVVKYRPDKNQQHSAERVTKSKLTISIILQYCSTKMSNNTNTEEKHRSFLTYRSLAAFVVHFEPGWLSPVLQSSSQTNEQQFFLTRKISLISTSVTPSTVTFSIRNSGCLFKMIFPLDVLQIQFSTPVLMLSDPDPTVISLAQPCSPYLLFPVCFLCI